MSGEGSSPALATCETRQVLLAGVSCGFPGVLPFRSTYRLASLYERNNLERDIKLNQKKKKKKEVIIVLTKQRFMPCHDYYGRIKLSHCFHLQFAVARIILI